MAAIEKALTIKRKFTRTEPQLVKKFMNLPTGNVCDAQGRVGAMDYRIKPVSATSQLCGTALTVDTGPRDNLAAWAALEIAGPGDILVITTGGELGGR
jgi:4-hydroxy-4-methyl-2-oxoglutarate aldolase